MERRKFLKMLGLAPAVAKSAVTDEALHFSDATIGFADGQIAPGVMQEGGFLSAVRAPSSVDPTVLKAMRYAAKQMAIGMLERGETPAWMDRKLSAMEIRYISPDIYGLQSVSLGHRFRMQLEKDRKRARRQTLVALKSGLDDKPRSERGDDPTDYMHDVLREAYWGD